jgi:hypothetical protein
MEPEHDEQLMTPSGAIASSYQSKRENFMTSLRKQENQKLFAKRRQHIMQSKQNHSTIENEIETFALFDTQLSLISGCESHAELLDEEILLKYMPHIECVSRTLETYQHSRFVKKVIESGVLKVLNCFILNYLNNSQSLHREQALHHSLHILSVCIQDDYNTLVQLDTELSLMDSLISLSRKDYTNVETVYTLIECIGNVVQLKAFTKKLLQESSYNDLNALVKRKICQANKNTDTEEVEDLLTIFLWAIWSMLPPISDLDDVCFDVDVQL